MNREQVYASLARMAHGMACRFVDQAADLETEAAFESAAAWARAWAQVALELPWVERQMRAKEESPPGGGNS